MIAPLAIPKSVAAPDPIFDDFLAGGPLTTADVVDCHSHLGPALYMQGADTDADSLVQYLDALGVGLACVSHSIAMVSDWQIGNTLLIDAVRLHPGRIFGYAFFNPRYPSSMPAELDRCIAAGLRGLKAHPDFHQTPADAPAYDYLYERASEENRVILCHYGAGPGRYAGAALWKRVVDRFPRATYVMAHSLPGRGAVDLAVEYFGTRDNVFFCLANAFEPGVIEYAAERLGAERLLYGSDGCWGAMATRLGIVCSTRLDDTAKRLVLGGNMHRLLSQVA